MSLYTIADSDPGRFLAAMLQGIEPKVSEFGDLVAGGPHAEDPASILRRLLVRINIVGQPAIASGHGRSLCPLF